VGDPYFPRAGNSGYEVDGYRVALTWDQTAHELTGTTVITATAAQPLDSFVVDFYLDPSVVVVDGRPAAFTRLDPLDVRITPSTTIPAGHQFSVEVSYRGDPSTVSSAARAWYGSSTEWLIAGEPGSAPYWYPSNDHPSDPATFDLTLTVPAGEEVISVGQLVSRDEDTDPATATWHWRLDQPAATYLTFAAIGQYDVQERTMTVGGRPLRGVFAVSEQIGDHAQILGDLVAATEKALPGLVKLFGPYPFDDIGGIVPSADVWFGGLETQTRPIYHQAAVQLEVVEHELAHMWFGDQVTVAEWNDIFDNEAYASYAVWLLDEASGTSAEKAFTSTFASERNDPGFWKITMSDPGADELFTAVYVRGPMVLQALSNVIGRDELLQISRAWAAEPHVGSLEQWRTFVQDRSGRDLTAFFAAWLDGTRAPAQTPANGF